MIDIVIPQQYNIVSKENERVNKYIDLASVMHSFRDSFPVCKLHTCCWDTQKFWVKQAMLVVVFKVKAVFNTI